jgi:hypothetical protein
MALTHMRTGDVLFTVDMDGSPTHRLISTAQVFGSSLGHRSSVHVLLATGGDKHEVIESVGSGLKKRSLSTGNYRSYCYRGPHSRDIRKLAVFVAEDFFLRGGHGGFGSYDTFKASLSPMWRAKAGQAVPSAKTAQFGTEGSKAKSFFCSNLVFRCYAAAGEAVAGNGQVAILPIPDSHANISPRDLEGLLMRSPHWHARNGGQVMSHVNPKDAT